jgi:hypothetical protein
MKICNKCGNINPESIGVCIIEDCSGIIFSPFTVKQNYEIDVKKYADLYERVKAKVKGIIPKDWFPEGYIESIKKLNKSVDKGG